MIRSQKEEFTNQGYILNCFGDEMYFKLTKKMVSNIRQYDSQRGICILTDKQGFFDEEYKKENNVTTKQFVYENHPTFKGIDMNVPWNKYGLIPKLYHPYYTPFKHTMFLDVDMKFEKDFTFFWQRHDGKITYIGKSDSNNRSPSYWHWGTIDEVMESSGINIPQTFTTFMIYDDSLKIYIEKHVSHILENIKNWKIKTNFKFEDGITDEIVYAIIFGLEDIRPDEHIFDWISSRENCDVFFKDSS